MGIWRSGAAAGEGRAAARLGKKEQQRSGTSRGEDSCEGSDGRLVGRASVGWRRGGDAVALVADGGRWMALVADGEIVEVLGDVGRWWR